jgi:Tfp pilus assembly protein PilO
MTLARRVLAEKRRYIYPLAGALLLNAVLLVAVVLPLSRKVEGGEASAQQAATALAAARADHDAARATVTGKDAADAELKKFYGEVLPVDQSEARRVVFKLQELARKANLNAGRARTEASRTKDSALGKMTVEQPLVGPYRNLRQFIYELETSPDFLILENVSLAQGTQGPGALQMQVVVSTYYRAEGDGN